MLIILDSVVNMIGGGDSYGRLNEHDNLHFDNE
jgi:hypothetical protein